MRKITVLSMVSLDGIMQAPGGKEEDLSEGFEYGGWTSAYGDDAFNAVVKKELEEPKDYILGRKTFEIWENYWPAHSDFWPGINEGTKYVISNSRDHSDWTGSVFIKDLEGIKKLKQSEGRDIQIWGSSEIVQLLMQSDLVDELRLKIFPIMLGKGKKLFGDNAVPAAFTLYENEVTPSGVVIACYRRAGEVKTGDISV